MKKQILILSLSLLIMGCTHKAPVSERSQMILISSSEELALGEKSYKDTLKKSKVIHNTANAKSVKDIGEKIANVVNNDYQWEFNLIENKAQNAFCLPGGKVIVYTGIFKSAKNDDQLATVISHEIAHALARHGAERMSNSMLASGVQMLGNILLGTTGNSQYSSAFNVAYGAGAQYGVLMPYGRMQESEADEIGIHLMYKAGYDVKEALTFWENMSKGKKESVEFFSTHPNSTTRIAHIKNIINEKYTK